jgi:peptidoglycan/LPS O-acetylase OafA/YrhL
MAKRIGQLDGIRALAITAVFVHHAYNVKLLWTGVDLFFILSGFLITGILIKNKHQPLKRYFGHFYERRALRILPPYLILMLITSLLFGLGWARHGYLYLFLMNFVGAFGVPQPMTLDVLWSLAVEEQFYLFWPLVIYFLSEEAIAWTAGAIIIAAPLLRWFCTPLFPYQWPIYMLTPFRMDLLAVGALLSIVWRKRPGWIAAFGHYGLIASALAVLTLFILSRNPGFTTKANTPFSNVWIYEMSLVACTGIILWALSGKGVWILNLSPVRYLGRISYSVYLIHLTFIVVLASYLHTAAIRALAAAALTIAYATVSWFFLEKPLLEGNSQHVPDQAL